MDRRRLPPALDYAAVHGLTNEARGKLAYLKERLAEGEGHVGFVRVARQNGFESSHRRIVSAE